MDLNQMPRKMSYIKSGGRDGDVTEHQLSELHCQISRGCERVECGMRRGRDTDRSQKQPPRMLSINVGCSIEGGEVKARSVD